MPSPPLDVGIGVLEIGKTYPCMSEGVTVVIRERAFYDGEEMFVGWVTIPWGYGFFHFFELNGRDWTNNPNNPYAVDWPAHTAQGGWGG